MEDLAEHYLRWTKEKTNAVIAEAKEVQSEMARELPNVTPVRVYPTKTGVVNHITAHRYKGKPAVRVRAPDKEQPGAMKGGWVKATVMLGGNKVYAVRNKAQPTVVHLVNFPTDHFSHGKRTGIWTGGKQFVSKVQEKGMDELQKRIEKVFEKEQ